MSFGYAVGDVIAILNLFERAVIEIRNYRDAPHHFQQLSVELDLLRNTIRQVLSLQTSDEEEKACLDRIRAIAIFCQQPLQAFIDKMQTKEKSLGHFRATRTLSTLGTRLHWSLITRNDVDDLRKTILSQLLAINVLLSSLQMKSLQRISPKIDAQLEKLSNSSTSLAEQVALLRTTARKTPIIIDCLNQLVRQKEAEQTSYLQRIDRKMSTVENGVQRISLCVHDVGQKMIQLVSLLFSIRKLVQILLRFSQQTLHEITRNARLLLGLQKQMQRAIKSIDAIPLHLSLPLIRLDDALGESWALPFQTCAEWETFQKALEVLVFPNNRPGAYHVARGQFLITSAKTGSPIPSDMWGQILKPGMHIQQAMIIPERLSVTSACPSAGCGGTLTTRSEQGNEQTCCVCGFSSKTEVTLGTLLQLHTENLNDSSTIQILGSRPKMSLPFGPEPLPSIQYPDEEETKHFRRIHTYKKLPPIEDFDKALQTIQSDPNDFRANQFLGWHYLEKNDEEAAISYLKKAAKLDMSNDGQSSYLLGRAYMQIENRDFDPPLLNPNTKLDAYEGYQKAIYFSPRCPSYWLSVGILYYMIGQHDDSLDAIGRCIKLSSSIWEAWHNLSLLYRTNGRDADAKHAYDQCLALNPHFQRYKEVRPIFTVRVSPHIQASEWLGTTKREPPLLPGMVDTLLLHVSAPAPLPEKPVDYYICCQCNHSSQYYHYGNEERCGICGHDACHNCIYRR